MLASGAEATLMSTFYNDLGSGCNKWFTDASSTFAHNVVDMQSTIKKVSAHKHLIMNYAREDFHTVKGALFDIVDDLIDSQRSISSTLTYFEGRAKYMTKRIDSEKWKYQLKYSTGVTKRCESDHAAISKYETDAV
jgi:hypothetical protein